MKDCTKCIHAEWEKNIAGNLHPSGNGKCKKEFYLPPLPASMYWINGTPKPSGGHISRKEDLKDHCPYYLAK